jgi:hypothetical protein
MYTTTDDLCTFWEALFAGRILSPELTRTYVGTHWCFEDPAGYGCGLYKRLDGSRFWILGSDAGVGFEST